MISINSIPVYISKIVPKTLRGKVIAGTTTALVTLGAIGSAIFPGGSNDEFVKTELRYTDSKGQKARETVYIEDGCGFENDEHRYLAKDGKFYEYNPKSQKWKSVRYIKTTQPQSELFRVVAGTNIEQSDSVILSEKDIMDSKNIDIKKCAKGVHVVSSGFNDLMIFHEDADGKENQLVFSRNQQKD